MSGIRKKNWDSRPQTICSYRRYVYSKSCTLRFFVNGGHISDFLGEKPKEGPKILFLLCILLILIDNEKTNWVARPRPTGDIMAGK